MWNWNRPIAEFNFLLYVSSGCCLWKKDWMSVLQNIFGEISCANAQQPQKDYLNKMGTWLKIKIVLIGCTSISSSCCPTTGTILYLETIEILVLVCVSWEHIHHAKKRAIRFPLELHINTSSYFMHVVIGSWGKWVSYTTRRETVKCRVKQYRHRRF